MSIIELLFAANDIYKVFAFIIIVIYPLQVMEEVWVSNTELFDECLGLKWDCSADSHQIWGFWTCFCCKRGISLSHDTFPSSPPVFCLIIWSFGLKLVCGWIFRSRFCVWKSRYGSWWNLLLSVALFSCKIAFLLARMIRCSIHATDHHSFLLVFSKEVAAAT